MIGLLSQFNLFISTTSVKDIVDVHLQDAKAAHVAYHQADLRTLDASLKRGIFDLRDYFDNYVPASEQPQAIAEIGVAIAHRLLGPQIFHELQQGHHQRTLCVHLPTVTGEQGNLAAAMARVAWEIARADVQSQPLGERNLLVRVTYTTALAPSSPLALHADEALRVLFIFAQSRGSQPLGARMERRELLRMFKQKIYPKRRAVAHFLTHGVTRQRLVDQIQEHSGYHIVHWSGHGTLNQLDLASPGGAKHSISGDELVRLFNDAGGFLPRLVFLGACQSGDSLQPRGWRDFFSIAQGHDLPVKTGADHSPGAAGIAYALLNGGIPSVVAMRFAVNDDYARELAIRFYRGLLADASPKDAAAALNQARKELANLTSTLGFAIGDHATAVLYGAEQPGLTLVAGPSPDTRAQSNRLHQIAELTSVSHEHFVGRTWELADLGADFIGSREGPEVTPVAIITGLGGMGKTALVAEALELWADRFKWVLLYQSKPSAMTFEATLLDIHCKLDAELGIYHEHVEQHPADKIYREATPTFTAAERIQRLIHNLIRALQHEAILLVLDNFETNLKPTSEPVDGQSFWSSQDTSWDTCLAALAIGLQGSRSRVLITSRLPLRALASGNAFSVLLGPLPAREAALYLRAHPVLSKMANSSDEAISSLAMRLLNASRFHPLLMDRFTRLAADPALHDQLLSALETLERTGNLSTLPDLFATTPNHRDERAYLDNALNVSLDQFIQHLSVDRRQLLWVVALANEVITLALLEAVNAELKLPDMGALLHTLVSVGLVNEDNHTSIPPLPHLTCHEVVRERIQAWMEHAVEDRGVLNEHVIRRAYGRLLKDDFLVLRHKDMDSALQAGSQALVYCVQAQAWDQMEYFVGSFVTSALRPGMVERLIPHLQTAAQSVQEDSQRLFFLNCLGDALSAAGHLDASSQAYHQAVTLGRAVTENNEGDMSEIWGKLAVAYSNWAIVYSTQGNASRAWQCYVEGSEAEKRGNRPPIHLLVNELQMLRLDIRNGGVKEAQPQVTERLERLTQWWDRYSAGLPVPEAPNNEMLARAIIGALHISLRIDMLNRDWPNALLKADKVLEIETSLSRSLEDIAETRFGRATVLMHLPERLDEARAELEHCNQIFHNIPKKRGRALTALANLAANQKDLKQAINLERRALVLHEQGPDPRIRATSHANLASYLSRRGNSADLTMQALHRIASIIYCMEAGMGQDLSDVMRSYAYDWRRAKAAGRSTPLPTVAQLVQAPGFSALSLWLDARQVDFDDLQARIDALVQALHTALSNQPPSEPSVDA